MKTESKPTTTNATPNTSAAPSTGELRTKHVAAMFNLKPVQLRRVLRSMPQYADGVHTNYRWQQGDKALPLIDAAIRAAAARKAEAKALAQARLAKAKEAAAAQEKLDKKVA